MSHVVAFMLGSWFTGTLTRWTFNKMRKEGKIKVVGDV